MRKMLAALCSLSTLIAIAAVFVPTAAAFDGVVNDSGVNVRSAPSLSAPIVGTLQAGDSVTVTDTAQGSAVGGASTWDKLSSGGWVFGGFISKGSTVQNDGAASARSGSASGRWIDVNLSSLRVRAMQGNTVVYTALTETGRPGWETPTGTFHILSKPGTVDMSIPGLYYQPNVPYTMYITSYGVAIHGNNWLPASVFGNQRMSHGCVGLQMGDAAYFFSFASVGTPVVIHY